MFEFLLFMLVLVALIGLIWLFWRPLAVVTLVSGTVAFIGGLLVWNKLKWCKNALTGKPNPKAVPVAVEPIPEISAKEKQKLLGKINRISQMKDKSLPLLIEFFEAVELCGLKYTRYEQPKYWKPIRFGNMTIKPPEDMYDWFAYFFNLPLNGGFYAPHEVDCLRNEKTDEHMDTPWGFYGVERKIEDYQSDVKSGRAAKPGYVNELPFPLEWIEDGVKEERVTEISKNGFIHPYHHFYELVWGDSSRLHPYHCDYGKILVECGAPPSDGYTSCQGNDDNYLPVNWDGVGENMSAYHGPAGTWPTRPSTVFRNLLRRVEADRMKPAWTDWEFIQSEGGGLRAALFLAAKTKHHKELQAI